MPFIGSAPNKTFQRTDGTRTGSEVWQEAKAAAVKIRADHHDAHDEDLGDAISALWLRDGGNQPTADLPLGSFKFTGVGNASARTHFAAMGQVQDSTALYAGTSSGTDTITATLSPAITAYVTGQHYQFKAGGTNAGAATLNLNSVGAKDIKKGAAGSTALAAGDITTGGIYDVSYDGTNFQLLNPGTGNFSGTLAIANGGTGQTTASAAFGALKQDATSSATGVVEHASDSEIRAATSGNLVVTAASLESASAPVTLTDAATIAVDWDTFINGVVTLGGNRTLGNPTNGQPGTWRRIQFNQDGTGSRTITWSNQYVHPGGTDAVLSTAASAIDTIYIYCRSSTVFEVYVGGKAWAT